MPEPEDTDSYDDLVRDGPPESAEALAEFVGGYLAALDAIEDRYADDPLLAAQEIVRATTRLIAGLSPPGSPGPGSHTLAMLLASIIEMQAGTPPSLLRFAPPPRSGRPIRPQQIMGRALAAAVMSLLMEAGIGSLSAADLVARELLAQRIPFGIKGSPARTVEQWREEAADVHGRKPINDAYRQLYAQMRPHFRPDATDSNRQRTKRAIEYGVAAGMFTPKPKIPKNPPY